MRDTNSTAERPPRLIIVMGVCSCGKSSIASGLAGARGAIFLDADDYHPASNIEKMRRGDALNDADRGPWLQHFATALAKQTGAAIGACSALKRSYREQLIAAAAEPILFIHLHGEYDLLAQRIAARENHFMPPSLLQSQLATLEIPSPNEQAITVDVTGTKEAVIQLILNKLANAAATLKSTEGTNDES